MIAFSKRFRVLTVFAGIASSGVATCIAMAQAPGPFTPAPGPLSAVQPPATGAAVPTDPNASRWRPPSASATTRVMPASGTDRNAALQPIASAPRTPIAKVTNGSGTLPNDHGQIWREYDITPYTLR